MDGCTWNCVEVSTVEGALFWSGQKMVDTSAIVWWAGGTGSLFEEEEMSLKIYYVIRI